MNMNAGRGDWPGLKSGKAPSEADANLMETLTLRLAEADQSHAIEVLKNANCSREELVTLLFRIRRSVDWQKISQSDIDRAVKTLNRAKEQLFLLKQSELGRYIFEHLVDADQLVAELHWVTGGAEAVRPNVSGKRTPRSDDAQAALIRYVKDVTGQYHDEEVATLITGALDAPEDEMLTGENLRQWRHRHGLVG